MDIIKPGASETKPNETSDLKSGHHPSRRTKSRSWTRIATVIILFGVAIILVAMAFLPHSTNHNESKYINNKVFQAVSVNSGGSGGDQIYFGNIKSINSSYLILDNVFYIPPSSSSNSITIEPLVCQVDAPISQMIINRSSVNWWENLQNSGKVSQAITNYESNSKTTCPPASSSSSSSNTSSTSSSSSSSPNSSTSSTTH